VMALARLFWMPRGRPPAEGAYQRYELDEMTAVVTLESVRAKCLVIGEDLGTVPDGFRERMLAAGIFSYRLLLFEREFEGTFRPPDAFPPLALASVGTHDLPTLPGYLLGRDIDLRERIGLIGPIVAENERRARKGDCEQLFTALEAHGGLTVTDAHAARDALRDPEADMRALAPVVLAAYRFIAQTPAKLVLVQIDDIIGERDQINLPGTSMQYANWRRKLSMSVDSIAADERFMQLGMAFATRSAQG
jgi:4-alpha-glucanotransferase